jgi:hypothetical protein
VDLGEGRFVTSHRDELLGLIQNVEELEHPATSSEYENLLVRVRWSRD